MFNLYWKIILIASAITFVMYSYDKASSADNNRFRIPVGTMLMPVGLGGGLGGIFAMWVCHHKISKEQFRIPICFAAIVQVATGLLICII